MSSSEVESLDPATVAFLLDASVLTAAPSITRGKDGHWAHPGVPWEQLDEYPTAPFFAAWGYEIRLDLMRNTYDEEHPIMAAYLEGESYLAWEPVAPTGRGWFLVSIHDTEDGPVAWYARTRFDRLADALQLEHMRRSDALDANRYRALRALCEGAVGAAISVNEHRLSYEAQPHESGACHVQWYPDTPVGFHTMGGATFDAMADAVVAEVSQTAGCADPQPCAGQLPAPSDTQTNDDNDHSEHARGVAGGSPAGAVDWRGTAVGDAEPADDRGAEHRAAVPCTLGDGAACEGAGAPDGSSAGSAGLTGELIPAAPSDASVSEVSRG